MYATVLVLALTAGGPAQCPNCGRATLDYEWDRGRLRTGPQLAGPRYAPAPSYFAAPAYEPRRTRLLFYEDTRRGLLPWRFSTRRYYFYER